MHERAKRAGGVAGLPTGRVTFLFTDIEGSSALVEALGGGWPAVLDRHDALLGEAVAEAGGTVVNTEGDAVFAVFTDPVGAVRAAVAAQRRLADADWCDGRALRVRMGLHTGEGILGGRDYAGIDVHRAARISAAAHGGQVLLSATARAGIEAALPAGVTLRDLGEHGLRGITEPERLTQLVIPDLPDAFPPLRAVRSRAGALPQQLSGFVGRERVVAEVIGLLRDTRVVTRAALGDALVGVGRVEEGLRALRTSLRFYADGERDLSGARFSLDFLSRGLVAGGDPEEAVVFAGGADALGERLGLQAPPAIVGAWDARAAVAGTLPQEVVERRWQQGRAMGLAELVSRACAPGPGA